MLADGTRFVGRSVGVDGISSGEVVFNTAMTGYLEILTDPSYARQLITLTAPHIGNVGATPQDHESRRVFCAGLIVKNIPHLHSNWRARSSLPAFLQAREVVAISDIDTRRLTRILRSGGAQSGCIVAGAEFVDAERALAAARAFPGLGGMDLARQVSIDCAYRWSKKCWVGPGDAQVDNRDDAPGDGGQNHAQDHVDQHVDQNIDHDARRGMDSPPYKVVVCDYGVKHNILRMLAQRGCEILVMPAQTSAQEILRQRPHGVFLSNGPGDPEPCGYAIDAIRALLAHGEAAGHEPAANATIPLFGICLGHQLLALASGARTEKMKFGHHGANHPVREVDSGRVFISSQNHGFMVRESSLPARLRITHRSLFDGSIQGLERRDKAAFSFQGHPEASPGPHDLAPLFDKFIAMMAAASTAARQRANPRSNSPKNA